MNYSNTGWQAPGPMGSTDLLLSSNNTRPLFERSNEEAQEQHASVAQRSRQPHPHPHANSHSSHALSDVHSSHVNSISNSSSSSSSMGYVHGGSGMQGVTSNTAAYIQKLQNELSDMKRMYDIQRHRQSELEYVNEDLERRLETEARERMEVQAQRQEELKRLDIERQTYRKEKLCFQKKIDEEMRRRAIMEERLRRVEKELYRMHQMKYDIEKNVRREESEKRKHEADIVRGMVEESHALVQKKQQKKQQQQQQQQQQHQQQQQQHQQHQQLLTATMDEGGAPPSLLEYSTILRSQSMNNNFTQSQQGNKPMISISNMHGKTNPHGMLRRLRDTNPEQVRSRQALSAAMDFFGI